MRIDSGCGFCRFYKTRVLAAKAVTGGHVKVNGARAKSSTKISSGDSILLVRDQLIYEIEARELRIVAARRRKQGLPILKVRNRSNRAKKFRQRFELIVAKCRGPRESRISTRGEFSEIETEMQSEVVLVRSEL